MTNTNPSPDGYNILWIDAETNGLMSDPGTVPFEIAAIITDRYGNTLDVFDSTVIDATDDKMAAAIGSMGEFVRNMHTETGLLERLTSGEARPLPEVDAALAAWVSPWFPARHVMLDDGSKSPTLLDDGIAYRGANVAGNSVGGFDLPLLGRFFPETHALCSYRVLDVTSIELMVRRERPDLHASMPEKKSDHTAMVDIQASIDQYRWYTDALFGRVAAAAAMAPRG